MGCRGVVVEGSEFVVDGGCVSVRRPGRHTVWDSISPGLCTKHVSALSVSRSLGLASETQWPSVANCVIAHPYPPCSCVCPRTGDVVPSPWVSVGSL